MVQRALLVMVAMCGFCCNAFAQSEASWRHKYSLTISPIQLVFPIVRLDMEFRVANDHGVGVFAQAGSIEGTSAFGVGAQYAYYIVGDFEHGMQLGGILEYAHVADSDKDISASANGIGLIAIVGYKYAAPFGLTVFINGGPGIFFQRAQASNSTSSASAGGTFVLPYLNLGVGWSF